jgi:hypothetical protein
LYTKKQNLSKTLYHLHTQIGNEWGNAWDLVNQNITNKQNMKMNTKYKHINSKIKKLSDQKTKAYTQTTNRVPNHTFYKRTENLTNVVFTDTEMQLPKQRPKI